MHFQHRMLLVQNSVNRTKLHFPIAQFNSLKTIRILEVAYRSTFSVQSWTFKVRTLNAERRTLNVECKKALTQAWPKKGISTWQFRPLDLADLLSSEGRARCPQRAGRFNNDASGALRTAGPTVSLFSIQMKKSG